MALELRTRLSPHSKMPPRFEHHRTHLEFLRTAALEAVDPAAAVKRAIAPSDFEKAERVVVVGAGKAGIAMAQAMAEQLGSRLTAGVMSVPVLPLPPFSHALVPHRSHLERMTFIKGGHPIPTEGSLAAGLAIVRLLSDLGPNDLIIALISGGGSALLEWPRPGLGLEDLHATTQALLRCGATIHEINRLRACLSQLKGGGLLRWAYPAPVLGLLLSDVVGNDLGIIASGLTVPMPFSATHVESILQKYALHALLPSRVLDYLKQSEELEACSPVTKVENRLIASNRLAAEAAIEKARHLGFAVTFLGDDWQGEARDVGARFAHLLVEHKNEHRNQEPRCFVAGGETTVTVRGQGKGGRNQELALAAAMTLAGYPHIVVSTFATDGVDGPTDAAGAIATGDTLARATQLGLSAQHHLDENNATPFFDALGDLVITGPTGTNVNDVLFGMVY